MSDASAGAPLDAAAGVGRRPPAPAGADAGKWVDPGPAAPAQDAWFRSAPRLEPWAQRGAAEGLCTRDGGLFAARSCAARGAAVARQPEAWAQPDGQPRAEREASPGPQREAQPVSQPAPRQPRAVAAAPPRGAVERRWEVQVVSEAQPVSREARQPRGAPVERGEATKSPGAAVERRESTRSREQGLPVSAAQEARPRVWPRWAEEQGLGSGQPPLLFSG